MEGGDCEVGLVKTRRLDPALDAAVHFLLAKEYPVSMCNMDSNSMQSIARVGLATTRQVSRGPTRVSTLSPLSPPLAWLSSHARITMHTTLVLALPAHGHGRRYMT